MTLKPPWRVHLQLAVLVAMTVVFAACGASSPAVTIAPTATPPPTATPVLPTASPTESAPPTATPTTELPTVTATPLPSATATSEPTTATSALPIPSLFEVGWEDRSPFQAGLISVDQGVLDRLPGATVYHMEVEIADNYRTLSGRQELHYTNREEVPLEEIYFRLYPNMLGGRTTISSLTVNGEMVGSEYELEQSALRIPLVEPLLPGDSLVIALEFEVEVPGSSEGNYGSFVYRNDVLALAHFYPIIPVYDDEGWNVEIPADSGDLIYADSSFYLVRVIAPGGAELAASGITVQERQQGDEQVLTFASGPTRDFYLLASERYLVVSDTVGETMVNSYAYEGDEEIAERTLQHTVDALAIFNDLVGTYPFTELDIAPTPNLALGIEYPAIVVITDRIYEPTVLNNNTGQALTLESTVAHEVAHQWFYSTVGNDQLDEPWLDESLVQYLTYLYFVELYGPEEAQRFYQSFEGRWQRLNEESIPIGQPVAAYSPLEYGAIIYGRGPLFFEQLAEEMGQPAFDEFLQRYYEENKFGLVTGETLKATAEESCACQLDALWEEWVEE